MNMVDVLCIHMWYKTMKQARCQWLIPVILVIQEAEIRRIVVQGQLGQTVHETLSPKNPLQETGLVEWLKVKALSSSPSAAKKKKKKGKEKETFCNCFRWGREGVRGGEGEGNVRLFRNVR
jgi:hypothetical protein